MSKRKAALAELSIAPVAVMTEERPIGARPGRLPIDRLYPNPNQPGASSTRRPSSSSPPTSPQWSAAADSRAPPTSMAGT